MNLNEGWVLTQITIIEYCGVQLRVKQITDQLIIQTNERAKQNKNTKQIVMFEA